MNARHKKLNESTDLGRQLRRLAASEANRRHLAALPLFRPETQLPKDFDLLLEKLDSAQREAARR